MREPLRLIVWDAVPALVCEEVKDGVCVPVCVREPLGLIVWDAVPALVCEEVKDGVCVPVTLPVFV